jgi:hypothetical protein
MEIKEIKRILVDSVNGPIRTIHQALDLAERDTVIKLCDPTYRTNIRITKPGIKIEPRDKETLCYIEYADGPVVSCELEEGESCILS